MTNGAGRAERCLHHQEVASMSSGPCSMCAPSEPGSAEQLEFQEWYEHQSFGSFTDAVRRAYFAGAASLRAQLQERARELLHLDNARQTLVDQLSASEATIQRLQRASVKLGMWMSAALDDPLVCKEMKVDIEEWLAALAYPESGKDQE